MLIRNATIGGEVGDAARADVRIDRERIVEIAPGLAPRPGEIVLDADGGAALPGLHDHHVHLLALAAALGSVRCGPPEVTTRAALARAISGARVGEDGFVRGVAYHEGVAGALDRAQLDALSPVRPLRIQHRSGALWSVNTSGLARLGLDGALPPDVPEGVERDRRGRATGRLFRVDAWLRARLGRATRPDLADVSALLGTLGVTGVTDATPANDAGDLRAFRAARDAGTLAQSVRVMGAASLPRTNDDAVARGERKILLAEDALPALDELVRWIDDAHAEARGVAIHCVTRAELAFATAAFDAAGAIPGDRVEHASVAPPELCARVAALGLCVVTQPNFVRERGDAYLSDVEPHDLPWLYRCRGLLDATVALGGGTDAPFGDPDPWRAMRAAVDRLSASGRPIGPDEALSPERALALFTTRADAPGGAPRRVAVGATADLCVLDRPWSRARDALASDCVRATIARGRLLHDVLAAGRQDPVDV